MKERSKIKLLLLNNNPYKPFIAFNSFMSSIIFLGTAGGNSISKQSRSSGGIVVLVGDLQFHLDPGPGTLNKAKEYGINLQHTTAILVSHNHINHCNDLNVVADAMTHFGIEHRGLILGSKSLFQNDENNYPFLTKFHEKLAEKIIPLDKDHKVGIDLVEIHPLNAEHTDSSAIGFKFLCPKFILSYSGDTQYNDQLVQEMMGSDILILNVPYPGNTAKGKNLDTESATRIVLAVKPRVVVLTHFGLEMIKADPVEEARQVQRITGVPALAAKDGLLIDPESYTHYKSPIKGFLNERNS